MSRTEPDLDRLARAAGIDPVLAGQPVSPDTIRSLLGSMGFPAGSTGEVRDSLARLTGETGGQLAPACHAVTAGDRDAAVPVTPGGRARSIRWHLILENGEERGGRIAVDRLARTGAAGRDRRPRLALPLPNLPDGRHRLELAAGSERATVAVLAAPAHCWLPPAMAGGRRMWGVTCQLYGLASDRNWGIGDFSDLRQLGTAAAGMGADSLAISPPHAQFPEQPLRYSPYAPSSRLFLNTLLIDVTRMDGFAESGRAQALVSEGGFSGALAELRAVSLVDYPGVARAKRQVFEAIFADAHERGLPAAFHAFVEEQGEPLRRHAVFEALSEHHAAAGAGWWAEWPEGHRSPTSAETTAFADRHADRVAFFAWLQWQADRQLGRAHAAATAAGMSIGVFRDLAVGSDPAGAEQWQGAGRYATGARVGAPPDPFAPAGQNWGLPPLLPTALEVEAGEPFAVLLRANMRHAGALRIDHAFMLRRLFWIPEGGRAADGAYVHYPFDLLMAVLRLESRRRRCLVVAEDLGTAPEGFSEAIMAADVLSYRLLHFERNADGDLARPRRYPQKAAVAASTHDLPTLAGWWRASDIRLRETLGLYPVPEQVDDDSRNRSLDRRRLLQLLDEERLLPAGAEAEPTEMPIAAVHRLMARTPSLLLLVQLEDTLGLADQANLPGTVDQHPNWRRRLPVGLDALIAADGPLAEVARGVELERPAAWRPPHHLGAVPRATYRLQLHRDFDFNAAAAAVPYLAGLGVSHVYLSPILRARPGSVHGYDITDHGEINPELGGRAGFERLRARLDAHAMGLLLDIVPNHMGVGGADNPVWLETLEWGREADGAEWFDIDWARLGVEPAKVMVPFLGGPYGDVLEAGELEVRFDAGGGGIAVWYHEHCFPVCPLDYPALLDPAIAVAGVETPGDAAVAALMGVSAALGELAAAPAEAGQRPAAAAEQKRRLAEIAASSPAVQHGIRAALDLVNGRPAGQAETTDRFAALHRLLERQHYRLAYWRVAASDINYRRFFDINELAGLRMEAEVPFERSHALLFELVRAGQVEGLRLDHVDGLADPAGYCARLQQRVGPGFLVLVEKILEPGEHLPLHWAIAGTTGYEALNLINGLFVDAAGLERVTAAWRRFARVADDAATHLLEAKRLILDVALRSELEVLTAMAKRIADRDRRTRDLTASALAVAIRDVIAWLPVYRTYVGPDGTLGVADLKTIRDTVARARQASDLPDLGVYDFVEALWTGRDARSGPEEARLFISRFQQLSGPAMAKGLEDTTFYRYVPLLSANEVGGHPQAPATRVRDFHDGNRERLARWPHSLVASATHDTKRGEDARARINVLSELSEPWTRALNRWRRLNARLVGEADGQPAPSANDQYLVYQTLVGAWPTDLLDGVDDGAALADFQARIGDYVVKALREAKLHTSWVHQRPDYEEAARAFAAGLLEPRRSARFLADMLPFVARVARLGAVNSLAQTTLKLTVPGVPDLYQGTEFWDLSLVDPDNRRPVDYDQRAAALAAADPVRAADDWRTGVVKQAVAARLLAHRAASPRLYAEGDYLPLRPAGPKADRFVAFARRMDDDAVVVVVPRLVAGLVGEAGLALDPDLLAGTTLTLPADGPFVDLVSGATVAGGNRERPLADLLGRLPVAVLATAPPDPTGNGIGRNRL